MKPHDPSNTNDRRPGPAASKLRGVLIPFPTPFGPGGEFDARALRANIGRWASSGVSGFVALGSTGERAHLDGGERLAVAEAARAAVPQGLSFVVGVGAHGTRATVAEAKRAGAAGADMVLVLTPHFYKNSMTQEALRGFFADVAEASPAPVVLYNIPQNTGVALAPETVARLAEHPNIIGIKDSSGDVVNHVEMLRLAGGRADFHVMTGHAGVLYASLCAGTRGAILAAACAAPRLCVSIYEAVAGGEHERARRLQARLAPLARAVTVGYGIGGLKAALDLLGYAGGPVRRPLRAPDEEGRREIARLLSEAGDGEGLGRPSEGPAG